jgi:TonB-dependent SusC/RagA subfamily outer membrane receptor
VHVEELIQGRVAGARVVRLPGGGISLRLWGPSTIYGDNEPLYVLDGVPLQMTPGRGLDWINPADILRIEILKDVMATAPYGVRGANGVILITTRRGTTSPD